MRHSFALAAIPAVMWAVWPAPPLPIIAKTVPTEGVRAQRMDTETFRARWRPLSDVAPATVVHEVPVETVSVRPQPPPARLVRRAALRINDICTRHGMRKVTYTRGKWQGWRCRR